MDGQSLIIKLEDATRHLRNAVDEYGVNGHVAAKTEREYRIALASIMLMKRAEGMPVTMLADICRGEPHVAALRMARDIADHRLSVTREVINADKVLIRCLEGQINREWGRSE